MSKTDKSKQVKNKIEKWLLEEDFKIKTDTETRNLFTLLVEDPRGIRSVILQPLTALDKVVIGITTKIDDKQMAKIEQMDNADRENFFWEIASGLLSLQVNFTSLTFPFKEMRVSSEIYFDGVTKNSFFNTYDKVRRGVAFILLAFRNKLGCEKKTSNTFYIG